MLILDSEAGEVSLQVACWKFTSTHFCLELSLLMRQGFDIAALIRVGKLNSRYKEFPTFLD